MFVAVGWPGFRERGSLGLQIDRRVAMGRIRARMTQPVIDRHEIDASFQEMDRCAVPQAVRVESRAGEAGTRHAGTVVSLANCHSCRKDARTNPSLPRFSPAQSVRREASFRGR
jgi:hypothetical protein